MRTLIKQNVLWVVLFMLLVTAGVAIWAVFSDEMGEIQEKILITTGTISGACILVLPCLAQTEHRYLRHAAWTGVVLISGTAALTVKDHVICGTPIHFDLSLCSQPKAAE